MDSSFEGFVLDPSKCSMLSMEEKRELVYQISKWSHGAPEMLQSWSRRELLQILCAEMGKERKYTGLTKIKMIEHLLKVVSEKKPVKRPNDSDYMSQPSPNNQSTSKRQRKTDNPSRLPVVTNNFSNNNGNADTVKTIYCQNSACRATLCREDIFCKRCSCCICYQYDDNKDPSLWLVCSSEPPFQDDSCGMSCHLECALKHEKSGIAKDGQLKRLDGNFYCVSCRKLNDLLGCWRKQLIVAKDTRRVDILCYRVSLSQKLLNGTEKYQKLHEIVDTAAKKLEAEVGPIAGLPVRMARGIVNRLSCGPEVQKLCASAVESLDSMLSRCPFTSSVCQKLQEYSLESSGLIRFENVSPTSLTVVLGSNSVSPEEIIGYTLWHRRSDVMEYPAEPTCTLFTPSTRFLVLDLSPATEYVFKVVAFCNTRELGMWEVRFKTSSGAAVAKNSMEEQGQSPATNSSILSNPSSEGDESNNVTAYQDQTDNPTGKYFGYCMKTEIHDSSKLTDDASKDISHSRNTSTGTEKEEMPGDSVSALDEERTMGEVVSVPNIIKMDSRRVLRNSTPDNPVSEIPQLESHPPPEGQLLEEMGMGDRSKLPVKHMEVVLYEGGSDAVPITPCKIEIGKDGPGRTGRPKPINEEPENRSGKFEDTQAGSSSKKRSEGRWDKDECPRDGSLERDYEYCVKVVRWLECGGHIEKNFRVKFLSWYSLRATPQERKIVKVFVDTLIDDPPSLAGQLIDTFSEGITSRRPPVAPPGFCMKLWH